MQDSDQQPGPDQDDTGTALGARMRAEADAGHPRADELRTKAREFDEAAAGFYADPQTVDVRRFLGCFARARLLWRDVSGEPLV